uniref:AMP-binding protein n=1 Tax=Ornithobacterium rhinotracheale TaxID=28251 RepID=UPI0039A46D76
MILDFSSGKFNLKEAQANEPWQQEILDFVEEYLSQNQITAHTSGSTGKPKEILLPKRAMQHSARLTAKFLKLKKGDSALLCLPVQYIAGKMMIVRAIEIGFKLICVKPQAFVEVEDEVDFAALTPMQAEQSLGYLSKMQKIILGGAPVSKVLENQLKKVESECFETYGMTETITHIALRKLNAQQAFYTLDEVQISQDERSCLRVQTPYFKEIVQTNDVVEILAENKFRWLGRADNIINSGGLKINPEEVEDLLRSYIPCDFIVAGVPDELLGEKLVLILESEREFSFEIPADVLPKNKMPKLVFYLKELPKTLSGKVKRKACFAALKTDKK